MTTNPLTRYLVMFRPPAREMCLNALEDVYNTCKLNSLLRFLDIVN
jgi:hypothetical protein